MQEPLHVGPHSFNVFVQGFGDYNVFNLPFRLYPGKSGSCAERHGPLCLFIRSPALTHSHGHSTLADKKRRLSGEQIAYKEQRLMVKQTFVGKDLFLSSSCWFLLFALLMMSDRFMVRGSWKTWLLCMFWVVVTT